MGIGEIVTSVLAKINLKYFEGFPKAFASTEPPASCLQQAAASPLL